MAGAESPPNGIIYFHYERSPFGRRVRSYLAFRRIAYAECIQPRILPRPDLKALGINYRRTPSMAIGRDVYLDTRMIISKLEERFPPSDQHPAFSSKETNGLASLLNNLTISTIFYNGVTILPHDSPAFQSEAFLEDRKGFYGPEWTLEDSKKARPEGLANLRRCFEIIESLFADGRDWVGGSQRPTLADLEGVWSIDWIISDLSPPEDLFSEAIYPKLYSWRNRFMDELEKAKAMAPKPVTLEGSVAVPTILRAEFSDNDLVVDSDDPVKLGSGASVQLFPTDGGGFTHKDTGRLVKLTKEEVAIAIQSETGEEVHIHAPRFGFRVQEDSSSRL